MTLTRIALVACTLLLAACSSAPKPTAQPTAAPSVTPVESSPPDPQVNPNPIAIPAELMLTITDVGSGYKVNDEVDGDWHFGYLYHVCSKWTEQVISPAKGHRERIFDMGTTSVIQAVDLRDMREVQAQLQAVRTFVSECAKFSDGGFDYTLTLVDSGLAGEESVLIKLHYKGDEGTVRTVHYLFIRQGEVMTQIRYDEQFNATQRKALAQAAADRLCAMASTC